MRRTIIVRIFFSKIGLILGLTIFIAVAWAFYGVLMKRRAVDREIKLIQDEITVLEGENLNLEKLVDYTKSSSFIEKTAKQKLNLKKKGEVAVIIEESKNMKGPAAPGQVNMRERDVFFQSNVSRWWTYFFGAPAP